MLNIRVPLYEVMSFFKWKSPKSMAIEDKKCHIRIPEGVEFDFTMKSSNRSDLLSCMLPLHWNGPGGCRQHCI